MTTGYPVGTVCVVTWAREDAVYHQIGRKVTATTDPFVWIGGRMFMGGRMPYDPLNEGKVMQGTDAGPHACCPVAWLRPLSDPDAGLEPVESLEQPA